MQFYEAHAEHREKFEVLAFHDTRVNNFEELDEKLKPIVAGPWKGKTLPFPVLLDSTGTTLRNFGITYFPTVILIDPSGKLVKGGNEKMLKEKLKE